MSRRKAILRMFRAVAAAWATAAYPGRRGELNRAARAALRGMADIKAPPWERAAAYAAAAAAAAVTEPESRGYASTAVSYALDAVQGDRDEVFEVTLAALAADADLLDQRYSPATLALSSTLWTVVPDWAFEAWAQLEQALLGVQEDWEVWTDWYEARLKAGEADQTIEIARVIIPDKIWDDGPKVVNRQIRHWFEERGIWRHAIADEGDPSPIRGHRLEKLPLETATVIGVRAALRAIPLLAAVENVDTLQENALSVFRATAAAWAVAKFPTRTANRGRAAAAYHHMPVTQIGIVRAALLAMTAATRNSMSPSVARAQTDGLNALRSAWGDLDGHAADTVFNLAVWDDLNDVSGATPIGVLELPLWPGGSSPEWAAQRWNELKTKLIATGVGWEVWVDWYEDRLAGRVRSEARELVYIRGPEKLWLDGPARVNTWIQRQVEKLEATSSQSSLDIQRGHVGLSAPPPAIPTPRPAAIEPIWRNGRLTLPKTPTKTDLTGREFTAALKSLRQEMAIFAAEVSAHANIDKRFIAYVSQLAEQIPEKLPRQDELFRLGHSESVFSGYASTVNKEWPPILAARYHALSLNYERTLRQSPLWREFRRNAAKDALTAEQIRTALPVATEVAAILRVEEAEDFIDPTIPQALLQVAEPLRTSLSGRNELSEDTIEDGKELLAFDVVESANNVLKAIFQAAIWERIWTTAKEAATAFGTEAHKSIIKEAARLGKNIGPALTKWTTRFVMGAGAYRIAGKPLIIWLVTNYPEAFKWLEQVLHFLS